MLIVEIKAHKKVFFEINAYNTEEFHSTTNKKILNKRKLHSKFEFLKNILRSLQIRSD